jgi:hypothetical protein
MPDIVRQSQRLGQILIQAQRPTGGPRDLRHFHRMRQAAAEMVRPTIRKDLRLASQPSKGA